MSEPSLSNKMAPIREGVNWGVEGGRLSKPGFLPTLPGIGALSRQVRALFNQKLSGQCAAVKLV